uniref:Ribulose bisphosphate carboxylase small subunit domain-containing protein n=1 Tax=Prasinoderma singulare TaxID=676789 RepID=A0A7S3C1Y8_9VIRI
MRWSSLASERAAAQGVDSASLEQLRAAGGRRGPAGARHRKPASMPHASPPVGREGPAKSVGTPEQQIMRAVQRSRTRAVSAPLDAAPGESISFEPSTMKRSRGKEAGRAADEPSTGGASTSARPVDSELAELATFVMEHELNLRGHVPSRRYLSDYGRSDLMRVVRRAGGPQAVAAQLGLKGEREETFDADGGADGGAQDAPDEWGGAADRGTEGFCEPGSWVPWGEAHCRAWQAAGSPDWATPSMSTPQRAPVSPVSVPEWVRASEDQAVEPTQAEPIELPEALKRRMQSFLDRNVMFLVEHHRTAREVDRYWVLHHVPQVGGKIADVLSSAADCHRANPHHYVRVTAFDSQSQVSPFSIVLYAPQGGCQDALARIQRQSEEAYERSLHTAQHDGLRAVGGSGEQGSVQRWRLAQLKAMVESHHRRQRQESNEERER